MFVPMKARLLIFPALILPVCFCWLPPLLQADEPRQLQVSTAPLFPSNHLWKPIQDEVFLQEIGRKIITPRPVEAVAVLDHTAYILTDNTIKSVRQSTLQEVPGAPKNIRRVRALDGALWALAQDGLYRFRVKSWDRLDSREFVDVCLHLGKVHAATRADIFRVDQNALVNLRPARGYGSTDTTLTMEDFSQVLPDPVEIGPLERIASYSGTLYLLRQGGLALLEGDTFVPEPVDWGTLPSRRTHGLLAQGSSLWIATDRGLGVLRGMALTQLRGVDGLPYEDLTCLATGFNNDLWLGTTRGAIRKTGTEFHFFGAQHWLPDERVRDITVDGRTVYIGTDGGLAVIFYEPCTLAEKAAFYERELNAWGFKRLGFVHRLYWSGD